MITQVLFFDIFFEKDPHLNAVELNPLKPLITNIKVEYINVEISSLIIIEQWRSFIFAIDIHSKCN